MSALESAFSNSVIITSGEREIREIREIRGITSESRSGSGTNTPTPVGVVVDLAEKKRECAPQDTMEKKISGLRMWRRKDVGRDKSAYVYCFS